MLSYLPAIESVAYLRILILLLTVIDDWLLAQDKNQCTAVVFLDLSKAFDNVLHDRLLTTLEQIGISGTALR